MRHGSADIGVALAIAEGATTPVPIASGALAWSTTTLAVMRWDGTQWRSLRPVLSAAATAQAVANAVATDVAAVTLNVPANALAAGASFALDIAGSIDTPASANTANLWLKLGATKIAIVAAATPASAQTAKPFWIRGVLTFRAVGASGSAIASLFGNVSAASVPVQQVYTVTPTAVATNAALAIALGFNLTTATAGTIIRADLATITQTN